MKQVDGEIGELEEFIFFCACCAKLGHTATDVVAEIPLVVVIAIDYQFSHF